MELNTNGFQSIYLNFQMLCKLEVFVIDCDLLIDLKLSYFVLGIRIVESEHHIGLRGNFEVDLHG